MAKRRIEAQLVRPLSTAALPPSAQEPCAKRPRADTVTRPSNAYEALVDEAESTRTSGYWAMPCPAWMAPPSVRGTVDKKLCALKSYLADLRACRADQLQSFLDEVPAGYIPVLMRKGDKRQFPCVTPECPDRAARRWSKGEAKGKGKGRAKGKGKGRGKGKGKGKGKLDDDDDDDDDDGQDGDSDVNVGLQPLHCDVRYQRELLLIELAEDGVECGIVHKRRRQRCATYLGLSAHQLAQLARHPCTAKVPGVAYVTASELAKEALDSIPLGDQLALIEEERTRAFDDLLRRLEQNSNEDEEGTFLPGTHGEQAHNTACIFDGKSGHNALGFLLALM